MLCYTHKNGDRIVIIDSVTSLHTMYSETLVGGTTCAVNLSNIKSTDAFRTKQR